MIKKYIKIILVTVVAIVAVVMLLFQKPSSSFATVSTAVWNQDELVIHPLHKDGADWNPYITAHCSFDKYIYYGIRRQQGNYEIYRFDTITNRQLKVYEVEYNENDDKTRVLCGISASDNDILLIFSDEIKIVNLNTLHSRKLMSLSESDFVSVYKNKIYIASLTKQLKEYTIRTGKTREIEGVYAYYFYVDDNVITYCDMKNGGSLSTYNLSTKKITTSDSDVVIGFTKKNDKIQAEYRGGAI